MSVKTKAVYCEGCGTRLTVPSHHTDEGWICNPCINLLKDDVDTQTVHCKECGTKLGRHAREGWICSKCIDLMSQCDVCHKQSDDLEFVDYDYFNMLNSDYFNLKPDFRGFDGFICTTCKADASYDPDEMRFINVYTVTRHYGGAEEGGWWFNAYECVEVIPVRHKYAEELREAFEERYIKEGHKYGDIYSVLGGQDVVVYIEDHPQQSETRERPTYE